MRATAVAIASVCICVTHVTLANEGRVNLSFGTRAIVTDNFHYQEDRKQSNYTVLFVGALGVARTGKNVDSALTLTTESAATSRGSADNYSDFGASSKLTFKSGLNTLYLSPAYVRGHDAFGTIRTEGTESANRDLDKWDQVQANIGWKREGEKRGSFFSDVTFGFRHRDYVTNQTFTRLLEREAVSGSALLGIKITSKTGLFGRIFSEDVDFDDDSQGVIRSGTAKGALLGIRWFSTAKFSGLVQAGLAERTQDITDISVETEYWGLRVDWRPIRTSLISVGSSRSYVDSFTNSASFLDTRSYGLSWKHDWTRRLSTDMDLRFQDREFVGSTREDDTYYSSVQLTFALDESFTFFTHVRYRNRDSNLDNRSFERTLGMIGIEVRLN